MLLREYIEARCVPVPFAGCWLWLNSFASHGYGNACTPETGATVAHRVSYLAFKGPIPDGMLIQHSCDQKWCVNPDHLSLGTDKTNALDKAGKGRAAKKLTPDDVREIRAQLADLIPMLRIAKRFGVHARMIADIRNERRWRHVHGTLRTDIDVDAVNRLLQSA